MQVHELVDYILCNASAFKTTLLEHECRCNRQINPLIMLKRNQLIRIVCLTLVEGQRKVRLLRPGHRRPGTIILASRSTDRQTDRQINLTLRDHNNCDH